ncbi:MAG: DUF4156 domain-containing protein [Candidatus Wenzhouxiangella sp. M2_3B_020]
MTRLLLLALSLSVTGCAWVTLDEDGRDVLAAEPSAVEDCRRVGNTTVSVRDRVAAVQRSPSRVVSELEILARNSAADMGGNRVVPLTPVRDGARDYAVYRCD